MRVRELLSLLFGLPFRIDWENRYLSIEQAVLSSETRRSFTKFTIPLLATR